MIKKSLLIGGSTLCGLALLSLTGWQLACFAKSQGKSDKTEQFLLHGLEDPFHVRFTKVGQQKRVLHFPEYSLGEVVIADHEDDYDNCVRGAAKGTVEVPPGKFVTFVPAHRFYQNPEIVKTFPADGFDCVWLSATSLDDSEDGLCDRALSHIGHLKGLRELNLDKSDATDAGLIHACELPNLQKITAFQVSVKGAPLAKFGALKQLRYLRLPSSYMQDDNLKYIAGIPGLRALSLGHAGVSDKGVKNLSNASQLLSLDIADCPKITNESIKTLATMKGLRYLILSGTSITSQGAMRLKGIPYFTLTWPSGNSYTREDIRTIKSAFPGTNVIFTSNARKPVDAETRTLFAPLR